MSVKRNIRRERAKARFRILTIQEKFPGYDPERGSLGDILAGGLYKAYLDRKSVEFINLSK